jgi:hypothetical protein
MFKRRKDQVKLALCRNESFESHASTNTGAGSRPFGVEVLAEGSNPNIESVISHL